MRGHRRRLMTKFNKSKYWNMRGLLRELEKDIRDARIQVWDTKLAIDRWVPKKHGIGQLKKNLKTEEEYLEVLLQRKTAIEEEMASLKVTK